MCKHKSCDRKAVTNIGYCLKHYKRWKRYGNTNLPERVQRTCEHCLGRAIARGYCYKHYQSWKRYGDPLQSERNIAQRHETKGEPYLRKNGREVHLQIMEGAIARALRKGEIVHHIDLDKRNNAVNNLYLCKDRREHNRCHYGLELAGVELLKRGIIVFENGGYRINL